MFVYLRFPQLAFTGSKHESSNELWTIPTTSEIVPWRPAKSNRRFAIYSRGIYHRCSSMKEIIRLHSAVVQRFFHFCRLKTSTTHSCRKVPSTWSSFVKPTLTTVLTVCILPRTIILDQVAVVVRYQAYCRLQTSKKIRTQFWVTWWAFSRTNPSWRWSTGLDGSLLGWKRSKAQILLNVRFLTLWFSLEVTFVCFRILCQSGDSIRQVQRFR